MPVRSRSIPLTQKVKTAIINSNERGISSEAERQFPILDAIGSIPIFSTGKVLPTLSSHCLVAQLAEQGAVNSKVPGSSPGWAVIIKSMEVFNNNIFRLSPNLSYETVDTPLAKITIIDNFYEDIDSVILECDKLPGTHTVCSTPNEIIDLRKGYIVNMGGTELPFIDQYTEVVREIIGYSGVMVTEPSVLINCNILLSDKHKDNWYNIHQDPPPSNVWSDRMSTVVMLNDNYDEGEGINMYYEPKVINSVWFDKGKVERVYHVQGKRNRAILFSPYIWHGAAFNGDQFKSEYRYTQVIFTNLR